MASACSFSGPPSGTAASGRLRDATTARASAFYYFIWATSLRAIRPR